MAFIIARDKMVRVCIRTAALLLIPLSVLSFMNCGGGCEFLGTTYYRDGDGDGFGDPDDPLLSKARPTGYVVNRSDCDDTNSAIYPGAVERCDGVDNQCPGDAGFRGIDENAVCAKGETWYRDFDGDGYGDPAHTVQARIPPNGYVDDNTDCVDTDGTTHPGAIELCDQKDNQCPGDVGYGQVDERPACISIGNVNRIVGDVKT